MDDGSNILLEVIKERFKANLENTINSILFLSIVQENGVEVCLLYIHCQHQLCNTASLECGVLRASNSRQPLQYPGLAHVMEVIIIVDLQL